MKLIRLSSLSHILVLAILSLIVLSVPARLQAQGPTVRVLLFYSKTCPHCHAVMEQVLPPLQKKYGRRLEVRQLEIGDPQNYAFLLKLEQAYEIPPDEVGMPEMFVGAYYLIGSTEINEKLDGLIQKHLAAGGVEFPTLPAPAAQSVEPETAPVITPAPSPVNTPPTVTPAPSPVSAPSAGSDSLNALKIPDSNSRVALYAFYDSHCAPCLTLMNEILPAIVSRYQPGQVSVESYDIEHQGYDLMRELEARYHLDVGAMPEVFIGSEALLGLEQIEARLPDLIDRYRLQGGVGLTAPESLDSAAVEKDPVTVDPQEQAAATPAAIHLAYFYQVGCQECDRVQLDLKYLQERYPQLEVTSFDNHEKATLLEELGAKAGLPEDRRLIAPAVFVGQEALVADEVHASSLENLIKRHVAGGALAYWENETHDEGQATGSILARFRSFGPLTIVAAGLVDGLNPCAFATVVFFVSYLALAGRRGKTILAVGGAFTLGVFLTYLGVGFGFLKAVAALPFIREAGPWLYGATALLCVALAVFSFQDYWRARQGKAGEMRLKLPLFLRKRVNRVIREGAGLNAFIPIALVTGGVISLIELACTGQIYLPVIMFVLGVPEMRASALSYLLLYNVMFIVPLVVVFLAAYWGTTSERMGILLSRRLAHVKLATAALFLLMGLWLALTVLA